MVEAVCAVVKSNIRPLTGEYETCQEMYVAQCNLSKRDIKQ
jgi:hypothetical protein